MLAKVFSCAVIGLLAITAGLYVEARRRLGVVLAALLAII